MIRNTASQSPFLPAWMWAIPVAAATLFLGALQGGPGDPSGRIAWFSVLILAVGATFVGECRLQGQFDLFDPLFMVFGLFAIFYPVRALFAVWLDESWFEPAAASTWKALWASLLGFASFAVGYRIGQEKFDGRRRIWLDRNWNLERARRVSLVFLLIGLAGFVVMRLLGGSFFYFVSLDSDVKSPESVKAWFFYLLWICVFMQAGALVQLGIWLSTGLRKGWTLVYCLVSLFSAILLSRHITVLFLAMLALSWHYQRNKIRPLHLIVSMFLLVAYLGVAGLYREWISPDNKLEQVATLGELASQQKELALRYVLRNFEELSNLSEVISITPSELPYQIGSTFAPVLLKPIPRAMMPTKPLGASAVFSQQTIPDLYESGFVTAPGAWGEWYLNFSWLGLVLGMAITGTFAAAAYKAIRSANEYGRVLLYLSFLAFLFTWLRTDFNSGATFGLYYFIPAILALAYVTSGGGAERPQVCPPVRLNSSHRDI